MGSRDDIVNLQKAEPNLSGREIAQRLGCSHSTVATFLSEARRSGVLPRKPAGRPRITRVPITEWTPLDDAPEPEVEKPTILSTLEDRDAAAEAGAEIALTHAEAVARLRQLRDAYVLRAQKCEVALDALGAAS